MNRIYYWIVTLILLCVGCRNSESSYVITGEVVNPYSDGNIVYLSHSNGDELINLDSVIVDGGRFMLQGVQEIPIMAYLRFKNQYDSLAVPTLFILENGSLSVRMDTLFSCVTGTLNNKEFETFLRKTHRLDSLRTEQHRAYQEQVEAGTMNLHTEQAMYKNDSRWECEQVRLAYDFIVHNSESPAALWLLETMQSRFSEEELQNLVSEFGGITKMNKRPPIVEEIMQRLRNANRIAQGNPFIDIELLDNRERTRKLSRYVGYTRYTVVGFWRSDSEPACRAMTKFARLQRMFAPRGATFLGISLDEEQEGWKTKIAELKLISSIQYRASQIEEVTSRYALVAVPSFLVIAPDGTIDVRNLTIDELTVRLGELLPYQVRIQNDTAIHSPDTLYAE